MNIDTLENAAIALKLLNSRKLTELRRISSETGVDPGEILTAEKWLKNPELAKLFSRIAGTEVRILGEDVMPDEELFRILPREFCREKMVVPISESGGRLAVALSAVDNGSLLEEVKFLSERELEVLYAGRGRISQLLSGNTLSDHIEAEGESSGEGRIVQLVQQLILEAIKKRASDIHLEPNQTEVAIRYRIDGALVPVKAHKILSEEHPALVSRIKILSGLDISEKRLPQDGRILFRYQHKQQGLREVDIRVSVIPSIRGEAVVLRILDRDVLLINLNALGFSRNQMALIKSALSRSHGMILTSGPTGSGKTTSLYAMISSINTPERKIVTIEDPVEYQLAGIEQIQAHPDIGLDFAAGLRSFLRHDPDVIMVGEIRDEETAEIAIRSSLTGHLVLSTLHTNDAPSGITRLLDMRIKPYLVASTLNLVISQRLVRLLCRSCRKKSRLSPEKHREYHLTGLINARSEVYESRGCRECENTGFRGRVALYEILPVTPAIKTAILQEKSAMELMAIARKQGMKTLLQAGIEKVKKGDTTVEEVFRVAQEV